MLSSFYLFASYFLLALPLILVFNDVLTRFVNNFYLYTYLQTFVTPIEIKIVGNILTIFGVNFIGLRSSMIVNGREIYMNWNCLGWQSIILFVGSFLIVMRQRYILRNSLIAFFLGILGIFWINILRIVFVLLLFAYNLSLYGMIYHDYFAAVVTILYLFIFWLMTYKYIL